MRKTKFIVLLTIGSLLTFGLSGCKDYDSDIDSLNDRLGKVESTVNSLSGLKAELTDLINAKKVVSSWDKEGNTLVIGFTDGSEVRYTPNEFNLQGALKGITLYEKHDNGDGTFNLWINGEETGLPYPTPTGPTPVEWKANGDGTWNLWVDNEDTGVIRPIPTPSTPTEEKAWEWKQSSDPAAAVGDKTLWIDDKDTGLPYPVTPPATPSGLPEGSSVVEKDEVTKELVFSEINADGDKVEKFRVPIYDPSDNPAANPGGITSLTFLPQFTLDGKPAIYSTALEFDTAKWGGTNGKDTLFFDATLNFKVNPINAGKPKKVEVVKVRLQELRAASDIATLINGEGVVEITDEKVQMKTGGVLQVTVGQSELDTFALSNAPNTGDPYYLAIIADGVISAYIPFVQEYISDNQVFLGERRMVSNKDDNTGKTDKGLFQYGVAPIRSATYKDSVVVLDPNEKSVTLNPELFFLNSKNKRLPISGLQPKYTYRLIENNGSKTYSFSQSEYKNEFGGTGGASDNTATVYKWSGGTTNDSTLIAGKDSVRVRITFDLSDVARSNAYGGADGGRPQTAGAKDGAYKTALKDSTNGGRNYLGEPVHGDPLIKVWGEKLLQAEKTANWVAGRDSIVSGRTYDTYALKIDTTAFFNFVGGAAATTDYYRLRKGNRLVTTLEYSKVAGGANEIGSGSGELNIGPDTANVVSFGHFSGGSADSIVARVGAPAGEYRITWKLKSSTPQLTYVAKFKVGLTYPNLVVNTNTTTSQWTGRRLTIYGDTLYTGLAAGANSGIWVMRGSLTNALDTINATFTPDPTTGSASQFDRKVINSTGYTYWNFESLAKDAVKARSIVRRDTVALTGGVAAGHLTAMRDTIGVAPVDDETDKFFATSGRSFVPVKAKIVPFANKPAELEVAIAGGNGEFEVEFENPLVKEDVAGAQLQFPNNIAATDADYLVNESKVLWGKYITVTNPRIGTTGEKISKSATYVEAVDDRYSGEVLWTKYFTGGTSMSYDGALTVHPFNSTVTWNQTTMLESALPFDFNVSGTSMTTTWGQKWTIPPFVIHVDKNAP